MHYMDLRPARDTERFLEEHNKLQREGSSLYEATFVKKDGTLFPAEVSSRMIERGEESYLQAILRDITLRKQEEQKIQHMAYHDFLTGLPNRTLLLDRLKQNIARARRHNETFALMFLDLDRFKQINDTYGHDIGDQVLISVSKRLTSYIRASDTVARLSGDEFIIIISSYKGQDGIVTVADGLLRLMSKPHELGQHTLQISASIGIGFFPQDGSEPDTLMKSADIALYRAKNQGRNAYHFYSLP